MSFIPLLSLAVSGVAQRGWRRRAAGGLRVCGPKVRELTNNPQAIKPLAANWRNFCLLAARFSKIPNHSRPTPRRTAPKPMKSPRKPRPLSPPPPPKKRRGQGDDHHPLAFLPLLGSVPPAINVPRQRLALPLLLRLPPGSANLRARPRSFLGISSTCDRPPARSRACPMPGHRASSAKKSEPIASRPEVSLAAAPASSSVDQRCPASTVDQLLASAHCQAHEMPRKLLGQALSNRSENPAPHAATTAKKKRRGSRG